MTEAEALEILKRDDDDMRKGYFCINDFLALEVAKTALEKQIAKKPIPVDSGVYDYPYDYECPNCRKNVDDIEHHCECGQKLDWSEV